MAEKFSFIKYKYIWFIFSGTIIVISLAALVVKGLVFGIEFKGGTLLEVNFQQPVTVKQIRTSLAQVHLEKSVIQPAANQKKAFIRTPPIKPAEQQAAQASLRKIGAVDFNLQQVGASWGRTLTQGTVLALVLAIINVLLFIAVRFEFKMGVAAVAALVHDVIIAVGIYALVGREVTTSTIAAFLTILGYSLYDTIVIFDRIRENSAVLRKQTYSDMVNVSIWQSLRRSLNTSLTSIIPVTTLLIFGGQTLKDFAFALLIGLVSGTYSSIFIASPILAWWKEKEPRYRGVRSYRRR